MSYFTFLKTFIAVYRCGSYSKASKQLGLTQPAISKQISSLEQQLNKKLFKRNGRGLEPTIVADDLAHSLAYHVDSIELIFNQSRILNDDEAGAVYIGGPKEFINARMIPLFASLVPYNVKTVLQIQDTNTLFELIHENVLDLAITDQTSDANEVGYRSLFTTDLVLLSSPEWAAKVTAASPKSLSKVPLLVYKEAIGYIRHYYSEIFQEEHVNRSQIIVEDLSIIHNLLCAGAGYSVLPEYLVEDDLASGKLVQLHHPQNPPKHTLYLLWNKFSMRNKTNLVARDAILKEARNW
tara:strand:+ start:937 stop:1821 length:885 start_codon:yes stop_codon:yes gene_type:complete